MWAHSLQSCMCGGLTLNPYRLEHIKSVSWFRLFLFFLFINGTVCLLWYRKHTSARYFQRQKECCRADGWCNATLLRRWVSECVFFLFFLITFTSENPLHYLNKDMQPILGGDDWNPPQHALQTWTNCDERSWMSSIVVNAVTSESQCFFMKRSPQQHPRLLLPFRELLHSTRPLLRRTRSEKQAHKTGHTR